jgi:hypothetical protein
MIVVQFMCGHVGLDGGNLTERSSLLGTTIKPHVHVFFSIFLRLAATWRDSRRLLLRSGIISEPARGDRSRDAVCRLDVSSLVETSLSTAEMDYLWKRRHSAFPCYNKALVLLANENSPLPQTQLNSRSPQPEPAFHRN